MPRLGKWEISAFYSAQRPIELKRITPSNTIFCDPNINRHSADAVAQISSQSCAWNYVSRSREAAPIVGGEPKEIFENSYPEPEEGVRPRAIEFESCKPLPSHIRGRLKRRPVPSISNYASIRGHIIRQIPGYSVAILDVCPNNTDTSTSSGMISKDIACQQPQQLVLKYYSAAEITRDPRRTGREYVPCFFNEVNAYAQARAAQGTVLPYVCGVYEDASTAVVTGLYLVMEYLPNSTTLRDMDSHLRASSVRLLREKTAFALQALHSCGVSHGSMKSNQLLICADTHGENEHSTFSEREDWFVVIVDLQYARFHRDMHELELAAEADQLALREAFSYCGCKAEEDDDDEAYQQFVRERQFSMGYC
ncbi:hypothetical protein Z517_12274 [Fonsecaea pedrosoi CBS 271.37]|uniref:Unplaced genomic scaffold supercont1.9, whole genome shotgun sequence n=1 Tax=Fonsecaea pedrosoi CBS 271.37 TaxID=1442368 RepID=A0A0D2GPI6_9EURO|nr:uncharacterized protein Z517_12274 [Fonsecaea pedrosoi CBS 271.37]KIW74334.1 hypothetical protein Z517_12274 [Fonsecaea pedrosoi CBS 271.37]